MAGLRKKKRSGLLKRPATITGGTPIPKSFKPQQARQLIRRFHVLQKNKHAIITRLNQVSKKDITLENYKNKLSVAQYKDAYGKFKIPTKYSENELYKIDNTLTVEELTRKIADIDAEIDQRGGLEAYQIASTQGQNSKRGGDSSKKLIEWLKDSQYHYDEIVSSDKSMNALEIGCLSESNLITTSGVFADVVRIDLNSQNQQFILQQDFMERPLPRSDEDRFNLISCSLVINFVPSAEARGEMLRRITKFLKPPQNGSMSSLFLVLPLPCITNSRYFDNERLNQIMTSLGFKQTCYYEAKKVAYWLFDWEGPTHITPNSSLNKKQNMYTGAKRNNFCIVLK